MGPLTGLSAGTKSHGKNLEVPENVNSPVEAAKIDECTLKNHEGSDTHRANLLGEYGEMASLEIHDESCIARDAHLELYGKVVVPLGVSIESRGPDIDEPCSLSEDETSLVKEKRGDDKPTPDDGKKAHTFDGVKSNSGLVGKGTVSDEVAKRTDETNL